MDIFICRHVRHCDYPTSGTLALLALSLATIFISLLSFQVVVLICSMMATRVSLSNFLQNRRQNQFR